MGVAARRGGLRPVLAWYFRETFGRSEGPGALPFYCDPRRVGAFAVSRTGLAAGREAVLFRLFVGLSMFQALRDVVIMRQQRTLSSAAVRTLADSAQVCHRLSRNGCPVLRSAHAFDEGCDVFKDGGLVDCRHRPGTTCHVKEATELFNRMGDLGKLPTSAWLHHWKDGGLEKVVHDVIRQEGAPTRRAQLLVERLACVHRVGRKLATLFVSALSTPALAPGLTPWFPEIDGNELVVIDTNVARAVDTWRKPGAPKTYDARAQWICKQAARTDLRQFHPDVPSYSPRLVQQALYAFCSRSNRLARGDACADRATPCDHCAPMVCPFARSPRRSAAPMLQ